MEKKKLGQWMLLAVVCLSFSVGEIYAQKHEFADFKRYAKENATLAVSYTHLVFLFNTRLEMTQQDQSIRSLEKQMQDDDEIIRLRTNIRRAAEAKVANLSLIHI